MWKQSDKPASLNFHFSSEVKPLLKIITNGDISKSCVHVKNETNKKWSWVEFFSLLFILSKRHPLSKYTSTKVNVIFFCIDAFKKINFLFNYLIPSFGQPNGHIVQQGNRILNNNALVVNLSRLRFMDHFALVRAMRRLSRIIQRFQDIISNK